MSEEIFYAFFNSPFGKMGIASSLGIVCLLVGTKEGEFLLKLKQKFPNSKLIKSKKKNAEAIHEIKSYLKGKLKSFNSKLNLKAPPKSRRAYTTFQLKVWRQLKTIPYGKTLSYKFIARKIGKPNASRAVGNAIAENPIPIFIPCHRVIKSNGNIGKYVWGENIKRQLLKLEEGI